MIERFINWWIATCRLFGVSEYTTWRTVGVLCNGLADELLKGWDDES